MLFSRKSLHGTRKPKGLFEEFTLDDVTGTFAVKGGHSEGPDKHRNFVITFQAGPNTKRQPVVFTDDEGNKFRLVDLGAFWSAKTQEWFLEEKTLALVIKFG